MIRTTNKSKCLALASSSYSSLTRTHTHTRTFPRLNPNTSPHFTSNKVCALHPSTRNLYIWGSIYQGSKWVLSKIGLIPPAATVVGKAAATAAQKSPHAQELLDKSKHHAANATGNLAALGAHLIRDHPKEFAHSIAEEAHDEMTQELRPPSNSKEQENQTFSKGDDEHLETGHPEKVAENVKTITQAAIDQVHDKVVEPAHRFVDHMPYFLNRLFILCAIVAVGWSIRGLAPFAPILHDLVREHIRSRQTRELIELAGIERYQNLQSRTSNSQSANQLVLARDDHHMHPAPRAHRDQVEVSKGVSHVQPPT